MLWKQSQCYFQQAGRWLSLFQRGDQHFIFQTLKQPNSDISIQFSLLHIVSRVLAMNIHNQKNIYSSAGFFFLFLLFSSFAFHLAFFPLLASFTSSFSSPANLFCTPPLLIFRVFLPPPRSQFVLRTFQVALTGMKRTQTHFGLRLFAVYINESFMC